MEPEPPKTIEGRMYRAELEVQRLIQEFEDFNTAMCQDIEAVRQEGMETKAMVIQNNQVVALMPSQIIKAIKDENRTTRLDVNALIGIVCTIVVTGTAVWGLLK